MSPLVIAIGLWLATRGGASAVKWPTPSAPPPPAPPPPGLPAHPVAYHRGKPRPAPRPTPAVALRKSAAPPAPDRVLAPVRKAPARKPAAPPPPDRVRKAPASAPGPFVQPVPAEAHPAAAATFPEPVRPMTPAAVPEGPINVSIRDAQEILVALGYEKDLGPAGVDGRQIGGLFGRYTKGAWAKAANAQGLIPTFNRVGPQTAQVDASTYHLLSKAARRTA